MDDKHWVMTCSNFSTITCCISIGYPVNTTTDIYNGESGGQAVGVALGFKVVVLLAL